MISRAHLRAAATLALGAFLAAPSFAAEAAEHGEHAKQTFLGLPYEVFWTLNLVVFLGLLAKFAGPALVKFLEGKQQDLAHALAEADRQRAEAAGMEGRLSAQIADLRREVDELAARAEREGQREREEILAEAQRESARIETAARTEIAQRLQQAKAQLTAHAAKLATELAENRLSSGLTREDKKRLFRDNLARLEKKQGGN